MNTGLGGLGTPGSTPGDGNGACWECRGWETQGKGESRLPGGFGVTG